MTDPSLVAQYDQAYAHASSSLDILVDCSRTVTEGCGDIDSAIALARVLTERQPMENVSLLVVAIQRLAQMSAEVTS
jgi:pyridoxal/pyridoxine/pyridoxamine kinase